MRCLLIASKLAETLPAAPDACHHPMPKAQDSNAHPADVVALRIDRNATLPGSLPELRRGRSRLSAIADFLITLRERG
jgi:hypothetical protein